MRNRLAIAVLLMCCFLATWTSLAVAQCPSNLCVVGVLQGCAYETSTAPVFSILHPDCINGSGSISYDLIAGSIMAESHSISHEGFRSYVQTADDFVITGPASATPIPLSIFLTVDGDIGGYSVARLSADALQVETDPTGPGHQVLRLDLARLPGEHFTVGMFSQSLATPNFLVTTTGTLRFAAPPPGYVLQSCQGFSALPVPTRSLSWGRVKQLYR